MKKYFGGDFSTLMKMYNTDLQFPAQRQKSWSQIEELAPVSGFKQFVIAGNSEVIN